MSDSFKATAQIKLVIWDLDDTFWSGTLSEEGVTLSAENIQIVKTLVDRGVMSSIVSKNNLEPVKSLLEEAGIWNLFIFPKISWNSKGSQIAAIVEQAGLRPANVLFIDDNSINIEEARFRFPTMMCAYPEEVLPSILSINEASGKDDRNHSRLKQYKQLEKKADDKEHSALSNVEFLKQCEIKVRFDFDVDKNIDRIIELINRSNQLNFTKIRLESDKDITDFTNLLKRHDIFSAAIFASDRYGSHGLIGFYMQRKNERLNELVHYAWSCRMMNAGLEQYVYERLGKPAIKVVEPVSNPICVFDEVDWIAEANSEIDEIKRNSSQLLLIGSCDLSAVASYCSSERVEFVNGVKNGVMTRYDDFGFILGDRQTISASSTLPKIPAWTASEFISFHEGLEKSQMLILSLSAALKGAHCVTNDGVVLRVHPEGLGHHIDFDPRADYLKNCTFYDHSLDQKLDLLNCALASIEESSKSSSHKFLLGANTRDLDGVLSDDELQILNLYNQTCADFCINNNKWYFIDINETVSVSNLIDDRHYTRIGYYDIAKKINSLLGSSDLKKEMQTQGSMPARVPLLSMICAGRKVSRLRKFGQQSSGSFSYLKQAIKLSPFSGVIRKAIGVARSQDGSLG